jgi:transposase
MEVVYERVAAIDVHKRQVTVAVRTPDDRSGQRRQQVRKFDTYWRTLQQVTAWLVEQQVTHVAMEATGVYWKPVHHALVEDESLEVLLVNAHHVRNVPGRKTDPSTRPGWPNCWRSVCCAAASSHRHPSPRSGSWPATARS